MACGVAAECEVGEMLKVGEVLIAIEQKSGRKVRLRIVAPEEMEISRRPNENGASRELADYSA